MHVIRDCERDAQSIRPNFFRELRRFRVRGRHSECLHYKYVEEFPKKTR